MTLAGLADLCAAYGSAEDILDSFPASVIGLACELMAAPKHFSMEILSVTFGETAVDVVLQTTGLDWLGFDSDGKEVLPSSPAKPGVLPQSFCVPVPANAQSLHIGGSFTYTGPYGTNWAQLQRFLWRAARAGSA